MTASPPPVPKTLSSKIFTFAAIGMAVGFGTCSIAASGSSGDNWFSGFFAVAGATLFFVSLAVIVVTFFTTIVIAAIKDFRK